MKKHIFISEEDFTKFSSLVEDKIQDGFVIEEQNTKLPYAVLSKKARKVDHLVNFFIFCATLGVWSIAWIYITQVSSKAKKILVALDEEGNVFEEKCYIG
jgi:hypothetical protein